jgi:hypothetical protein
MQKANRILAAMIVAFLITGCASVANAPDVKRSPLEIAELAYAEGSIGYEFGMTAVVDARAARLISDAQWTRVDQAQKLVRQYAPMVRSGLDLWRATGSKPTSFDEAMSKLAAAFSEVTAIRSEVKP